MKKIAKVSIILFSVINYNFASDIFEEFKNKVQQQFLAPFNKDITGAVCSATLNTAESLGLFSAVPPSIGLDIKTTAVLKKISSDNLILGEMPTEYIPFLSVGIAKGLPFNFDLYIRFMGYSNFTFYGFGIKYKFLSFPPVVPVVNLSVSAFYNILDVKEIFKHNSQSFNFIVSVDKIPFIKPYILVGLDNGELIVDDVLGLGALENKYSGGLRYEAGIKFSFIPFIYINLGYSKIYSEDGYTANLGLKF
ncbi:MAG: hypothetical protein N2643_03120 [Endomicrobia bacterium]|nr:hypothetical protein [Endomicrobiia bacterium]